MPENCSNTDRVVLNTDAITRVAVAQATLSGQMAQFIANQDRINAGIAEIVANHLPHISGRLGKLEGKFAVTLWALGAVATLVIASGALSVLS